MSAQQRPNFETIQDMIRYWRECLNERGIKPAENVAAGIVDSGLFNDIFDHYYAQDEDVAAIYDAASDLEWSNGSPEGLALEWGGIQTRMKRLERRYLTDASPDNNQYPTEKAEN